jgi:Ca-activated chloride channel family protein
MIEQFHLIRPLWLAALPVLFLLWWMIRRRDGRSGETGDLIAPHLRAALTVNRQTRTRLTAVDGVMAAGICLTLAAAGPAWNRIPSPWFSETAPLIVALEVSDSMRANDLLPSRLERARFKILDLIGARTGGRTAIIAYAGSAHIVVPPSTDAAVLKPLLESLDPAVMPVPGSNAAAALPLALDLLGDQAGRGSVLFVNDGFEPADVAPLSEFAATPNAPGLAALVVGTQAGGVALMPDGSPVTTPGGQRLDTGIDTALLGRIASAAGVAVVRVKTGDGDLRTLLRAISSHLTQAEDPDAQWEEQGWWLLWPAALLILVWFRRGWTMQW